MWPLKRNDAEKTASSAGTADRDRDAAGLLRVAGRVTVWGVLALILVRGVGSILSAPPANPHARPGASHGPGFPNAEARAFAVRFATAYLAGASIDAYLAQDLRDQTARPSHGSGMPVAMATVAREEPLSGSRAMITVATSSTSGSVRYLAVPVGRDGGGGLAVVGAPAMVAPPPRGTPSPLRTEPLDGPHAAAVRDLVDRFLRTYIAGGDELRYYLAPSARLARMPRGLRVTETVEITQDLDARTAPGELATVATLTVRDRAAETTYRLGYRVRVARSDRWYVTAVTGGPRS